MRLSSIEKERFASDAADAKAKSENQGSEAVKYVSRRFPGERFQRISEIVGSIDASPEVAKLKYS